MSQSYQNWYRRGRRSRLHGRTSGPIRNTVVQDALTLALSGAYPLGQVLENAQSMGAVRLAKRGPSGQLRFDASGWPPPSRRWQRKFTMRQRTVGIALGVALALGPAVVVSHDFYQAASFDTSLLCQRSDGSFWRDPSNGCTRGNDRRCADAPDCADSTTISEGWRHTCTWLIFDSEFRPSGGPPFYTGPAPGRGCLGRH